MSIDVSAIDDSELGVPISAVVGKTIVEIEREADDEIRFRFSDGTVARMWHQQSCCETVEISEVHGDLDGLLGSPLTLAGEVSEAGEKSEWGATSTWTFYKLATIHESVTIRWFGTSNGYYSERVSFVIARTHPNPPRYRVPRR